MRMDTNELKAMMQITKTLTKYKNVDVFQDECDCPSKYDFTIIVTDCEDADIRFASTRVMYVEKWIYLHIGSMIEFNKNVRLMFKAFLDALNNTPAKDVKPDVFWKRFNECIQAQMPGFGYKPGRLFKEKQLASYAKALGGYDGMKVFFEGAFRYAFNNIALIKNACYRCKNAKHDGTAMRCKCATFTIENPSKRSIYDLLNMYPDLETGTNYGDVVTHYIPFNTNMAVTDCTCFDRR